MIKIVYLIVLAFTLSACGSSRLTADSVRKQEKKALKAIDEAQEATVKLANMKEQYSADARDAQIDALEKKSNELKKDIKKLGKVSSESAQAGTASTVKDLERQRKDLADKMEKLKSVERENWQSSVEAIKSMMDKLRNEVDRISANLPAAE